MTQQPGKAGTTWGQVRRLRLAAIAFLLLPVVAMVASAEPVSAQPGSTTTTIPSPSGPTSIVQLGDSVASGEGTLYGFTFNTTTGKWEGPANKNPTWLGPYPDCHQSPDAYGQVLANSYPGAKFTQLACTGATFDHGIAGAWSATVPAEFGDWANKTNLNATYTDAKPDLVLVTLGADDVQFVNIVTKCVEAFSSSACTKDNPNGPSDVIKKDFFDYLPTLEANLKTLASWITARGKALGVDPKIVFTTYPNPLPDDAPAGGKNFCPDSWLLYNDQLNYLSSLVPVLDKDIVSAIDTYVKDTGDRNVAVVNLANAFDGRQWCAKSGDTYIEPDAYGFSIYTSYFDTSNPSPFHPTPAGQQIIAQDIKPTVDKLFSQH